MKNVICILFYVFLFSCSEADFQGSYKDNKHEQSPPKKENNSGNLNPTPSDGSNTHCFSSNPTIKVHFIVSTTNSMMSMLEIVKAYLSEMVERIQGTLIDGVKIKTVEVSLTQFKDSNESIVTVFSDVNVADAQRRISQLRPQHERSPGSLDAGLRAVRHALVQKPQSENAANIFLVISDDFSHNAQGHTNREYFSEVPLREAVEQAQLKNLFIYDATPTMGGFALMTSMVNTPEYAATPSDQWNYIRSHLNAQNVRGRNLGLSFSTDTLIKDFTTHLEDSMQDCPKTSKEEPHLLEN